MSVLTANAQTVSRTILGHEYVDLGLPSGIKWATCNVGASSPYESGEYYAWGETCPKNNYCWNTLRYCTDIHIFLVSDTGFIEVSSSDTLSNTSVYKYEVQFSKYYSSIDNMTSLDKSDDVAFLYWGKDWRMPTALEWEELTKYCSLKRATKDGIKGCIVTSKKNGNSIFLAASGRRLDRGYDEVGISGYYWSSSLYAEDQYCSWSFLFTSGFHYLGSDLRYCGFTVRPVSE